MQRIASLLVVIVIFIVLAVLAAGCQTKDDTPRSRAVQGNSAEAPLARSAVAEIKSTNNLETIALFTGPMPTGVTVSKQGRIFVCFPRWGDPVEYTVGEVTNGQVAAYPNLATNKLDTQNQTDAFVSVQSVVVDPQDRLWILDTGSINMGPVSPGGPKLVCYDLKTNQLVKRINFNDKVVLPTTYLNDVRFNLNMGKEGVAFITDSSDKGPNGIIVVDLASGESWRKLNDHPSTKADENFTPTVEGQPLKSKPKPDTPAATMKIGSDGIAISPDGKTLYYCPLASHKLHSVSTEALADGKMSDDDTARTVRDLGPRDFASDGLACDPQGNLLLTDYEHNALRRMRQQAGDGQTGTNFEVIAQDPKLIWPDTLSVSNDDYVYVIANQLNRQKQYHEGKDLRKQPYALFRVKLQPARLADAR